MKSNKNLKIIILKNLFLKTVSVILVYYTLSFNAAGELPFGNSKGKYSELQLGHPYLSISAGAGIWRMPLQPGMQNLKMPFSAFIEYGRTAFPVSLIAGASILATFNIDRFMLNPNNLMIALQYAPLTGTALGKKFNIYASGGFNACYSRFTENLYPGIVNYEYKVEKKIGAGISAGLGAGYRYKSGS